MKKLSNLITTLLMLSITAPLQAQMKNWFIAPNKVDVQINNVVVTPIAGSPATAIQVANGVYDSGNNLVFYIADNKVYDYNNTLLGTIITGGAEVIIVPFGTNDTITNCQRKYNIFSTWGGGNSITGLYRAVVDMNSLSVETLADALVEVQFSGVVNTEFGAIALGLPHGVDQERYLYFMAGSGTLTLGPSGSGQIHKVIVNNDGTVTVPVNTSQIYPTTPLDNDGARIFSRELELSADGKWLAWASYAKGNYGGGFPTQQRYHYLALDGNGDADVTTYGANVYQEFNIPGANYNLSTSGFRGVEFYQDGSTTKLFVGAGTDGVFSVDVAIPYNANQTPTFVNNSPAYGFSQIELAYNGNLYASSGSLNIIGAFNPTAGSPSISTGQPSFAFPNPPKADYTLGGVNPNSTLYTLPDQIDGQDYSSITPSVAPQVVTTHTLNYPANASTNQTATWSYGTLNNPLGVSVPIHVTGELRIRQNSNLTISGMTFKFSPDAKVIVEPGSTLTLTDGTLLTSNYMGDPCNVAYTWQGVEVWGSQSNQSQNIMPLAVGKLTIKNNSIIEYAICGVRAQKFYNPAVNLHRGGIIVATTGATFKNCIMDVEFLPYVNLYNGKNYGNRSYFTGVNFMNDNNYIFSNTPQHVYIDGCTGISFLGCQFNNHNSVVMFNKKSMGIKSMNSNFIVNNGTSFNNLYRAIDARSTGVPISFTVANSTFTNNQTGIYTSYVNNFNLLLNTFNVGGNQMTGATVQLGIQNMYGTGFTIEENHFNKSYNPAYNPSKFGIASYQTGTSSNQIYKNTFNEVNFGNYAWGINRSSTNPNFQGLQYLCNENTQNVNYDFYIYTSGETTWDGIRLNQGSLQSPARNTFSVGGVNQGNDIYNFSPAQLSYYYQTGNTQQTPVSTYKVTTIPISGSETCPSNLCDPPCALRPLDEVELSQLYMEYDSAETAYLNLLYTYNTLMDGGSTNNLLTQIQQTWSTEATTLRDELLLLSPYVSQEVLRDVAGTGILPPAMLLVVCMANPDATRSEDFLDYLQYDIPSPLPAYMIAAIETTWDVGTSRTVMENTLGDYNEKMALVSNKILSDLNYKNNQTIEESNPGDTTNISQQINYWLNRIQTLEAKYEMAEHYFEEGSYALAEDVLLSIPLCYRLTEAEQQTLTSYNYIYQYRKNLLDSGKTLSMLDSSQINELILFANNNANIAGSIAENALCFYYDICTQDNYDTTGTGNNRQMRNTNIPAAHFQEVQDVVACRVMVLPNPATDKATFQYSINSLKDEPEFEIRDMTGREIMKVRITEKEGVIEWQTVVVKSGMYYFSIKAGSKTLARGKLTVRK